MNQYKDHPFVQALNVIVPLVAPSFEIVSIRDNKGIIKGPTFEYVISSLSNKVYDKSKNKFRSTYNVLIGLAVMESKTPLSWCEYDELKDAQSRQALFTKLDEMLESFLIWLVNPNAASKSVSNNDTIYSKYDFQIPTFRGGVYYSNSKGPRGSSGLMFDFDLSCFTGEGLICCADDGSKVIAEKIQTIVKEESNSFKLLQKRIDQ